MKRSGQQILIIVAALALIIIIWFLPRTTKKPNKALTQADTTQSGKTLNIAALKDSAFTTLNESQKATINTLYGYIQTVSDTGKKVKLYDSLATIWISVNYLPMAAVNYERTAKIESNKTHWVKAGDAFFNSFTNSQKQNNKVGYINSAIRCYQKALNLAPDDLSAKTSLAVCYVEGSSLLGKPPMKGILMLLDVLKKDPNNLNALVNLGYFSIKSGQYKKARERFNQVIKSHPNYAEAYIYLSDLDLNEGDTTAAINHLKKYKSTVKDKRLLPQVDAYLNKLENKEIK